MVLSPFRPGQTVSNSQTLRSGPRTGLKRVDVLSLLLPKIPFLPNLNRRRRLGTLSGLVDSQGRTRGPSCGHDEYVLK